MKLRKVSCLLRLEKIKKTITGKDNPQVCLSSHTPAIVKRLSPEKTNETYKYIKETVHNYPELYFAKLVVIGEGDSEEVIFNWPMEVMDVDFDDNIVTFAPLGHRFVNRIWKLLETLHISYITLLDLDAERDGGGWGRVKYALKQLIISGKDKNEVLLLIDDKIMSDKRLETMHKRELKDSDDLEKLLLWVE